MNYYFINNNDNNIMYIKDYNILHSQINIMSKNNV